MSDLRLSIAKNFLLCNISTEDAAEQLNVDSEELTTIYSNYLFDKQLDADSKLLLDKYSDMILNL